VEYLKKNKVFIFLIIVLTFSIFTLTFKLLNEESSGSTYQTSNVENNNSSINSFKVELNSPLDLTFYWNITRGNDAVEKVEIYHEDVLLQDVSNNVIYSISLFNSGIHTGNNEFTLKVYLQSEKVLQRNQYLYIDEVQEFKMSKENMDTKVRYIVTYYYDKEHEVNVPQVQLEHNRSGNIQINFIESSVLSDTNGFKQVQAIYEIDKQQLNESSYTINFTFLFDKYNLRFTQSDTITL